MKVESIGCADGYDAGCERKVKNNSKVFVTTARRASSLVELGKTAGKMVLIGLMGKIWSLVSVIFSFGNLLDI